MTNSTDKLIEEMNEKRLNKKLLHDARYHEVDNDGFTYIYNKFSKDVDKRCDLPTYYFTAEEMRRLKMGLTAAQ